MYKHEELILEAQKLLNNADHFTHTTYPMLKETKLLLTILKNINESLTKAMDSVLEYEKLYKRIPEYPNDFYTKLDILKTKCIKKYALPRDFIQLIKDTKELLDAHKKSSMVFPRNNKLIICSDDFQTKSINITQLKLYLSTAKPFIERTKRVISRK